MMFPPAEKNFPEPVRTTDLQPSSSREDSIAIKRGSKKPEENVLEDASGDIAIKDTPPSSISEETGMVDGWGRDY